MFTSKKSKTKASSRRQIDIEGVRDSILLLPKHQYRAVLQISSINFELKSEDEQDAIIDTYQSFLNSLAVPLQIVVRVREMDMDKYLSSFSARMDKEDTKIYKDQVKHYTEFVSSLVTKNKILSRQFFVILPVHSVEKDFDVVKERLLLNVDIVSKGLRRLGMQARQLDSVEVLDLFYSFYSPTQAKRQPLKLQTLELLKGSYV